MTSSDVPSTTVSTRRALFPLRRLTPREALIAFLAIVGSFAAGVAIWGYLDTQGWPRTGGAIALLLLVGTVGVVFEVFGKGTSFRRAVALMALRLALAAGGAAFFGALRRYL